MSAKIEPEYRGERFTDGNRRTIVETVGYTCWWYVPGGKRLSLKRGEIRVRGKKREKSRATPRAPELDYERSK